MNNYSRIVLATLTPPIRGDNVYHRTLLIVGDVGFAKSTTAQAITVQVKEFYNETYKKYYGDDCVNVVMVHQISRAMDFMDLKPVQIIIIDDAARHQFSRGAAQNKEEVSVYYDIRHHHERTAERMNGVVITIWIIQRYKILDICFRSANVILVKSNSPDEEDKKLMDKKLVPKNLRDYRYVQYLNDITAPQLYTQNPNDALKSWSVAVLPHLRNDNNFQGLGYFYNAYMEKWIDFMDDKDDDISFYVDDLVDIDGMKVIEKLRKSKRWKRRVNMLYYYRYASENERKNQKEIATFFHKSQSQVSKDLDAAMGKVDSTLGHLLEDYIAKRESEKDGDVKKGADREPDVVNKLSNETLVYSCKATHHKKLKVYPSDMTPELRYCKNHNIKTFILVAFNVLTKQLIERELKTLRLPEFVEITFK